MLVHGTASGSVLAAMWHSRIPTFLVDWVLPRVYTDGTGSAWGATYWNHRTTQMDSTLIEIQAKVEWIRVSLFHGFRNAPTVLIEVNGDREGKPCDKPRWKIRLELTDGVTLNDLFDAIEDLRVSDAQRRIGHTMMQAEARSSHDENLKTEAERNEFESFLDGKAVQP